MDQKKTGRNKKKLPPGAKKAVNILVSTVLIIVVALAALLEYLTLTEYRPQDREIAAVDQLNWESFSEGDSLKILTWNCGYGALGSDADFFMDGGKHVNTADKEQVKDNLGSIVGTVAEIAPDVVFLQEIDDNADRSHHIDEEITVVNDLIERCDIRYSSSFAYNLNVNFVPFPIPPVGKVRSGLLTLTAGTTNSAERIQLPCSFKWPVRLANYKRCLLLERLPLQNSEKELVLINLHLEAYGDSEAKERQAQALIKIFKEEASKGNYVIAGGGFDQTFSNTDISAYPLQEGKWAPGEINTEEFGDDLQFLMDSSTPTCRSLDQPYEGADQDSFQYYVIDGYILSSNIEVNSCETKDLGFVNTNHNPVLLECTLR